MATVNYRQIVNSGKGGLPIADAQQQYAAWTKFYSPSDPLSTLNQAKQADSQRRVLDLYTFAKQNGFDPKSYSDQKLHGQIYEVMITDYLRDKGLLEQAESQAGILNSAKNYGYSYDPTTLVNRGFKPYGTTEEQHLASQYLGALDYLDSYREISSRAQAAGIDISGAKTLKDLSDLISQNQQYSNAFNATSGKSDKEFSNLQTVFESDINNKSMSEGIKSVVLTTPDGKQHRVEVGSKAYNKYLAMGANTGSVQGAQSSAFGTPGYTTPDRNQPISSYIKQVQADLARSREISSAAGVGTGYGTTNVPSVSPATGNVGKAAASVQGVQTTINSQIQAELDRMAQIQAQRDAAVAAQQKETKGFLKDLLGSDTTSETRQQAFEDIGVDPRQFFAQQQGMITEIGALTQEYNSYVAQRDAAIAQAYDRQASNSFINNQIGQIERNAAPRLNQMSANINAKAGVLQALQGNFAEAQKFVDTAVQDATADKKFALDMFTTFYEINQDQIDRLDSDLKDSLNYGRQLALQSYEDARADAENRASIILDAAKYGVDLSSYVTSSTEELRRAYARQVGAIAPSLSAAEKGLGGTGSGDVDTYANYYRNELITVNDIPQSIRGQVLARALEMEQEDIVTQQNTTSTPQTTKPLPTARELGSGIRSGASNVGFNKYFLPELASNIRSSSYAPQQAIAGFFEGLFGL